MRRFFHGISVAICLMLVACDASDSNTTKIDTKAQQAFLPVEEAFVFSAKMTANGLIKAQWKIADGYHLYKNQFKFTVSPASYQVENVNFPKGDIFSDKNLGKLESYAHFVEISIQVSNTKETGAFELTSKYQGCADVGLCYPPETRVSRFEL